MTTEKQSYEPPVNDPREEGRQHWDRLRSELMVTRDALRASEVDREAMARTIDDLRAENKRLLALREEDRTECVALKTSLEDVGRLVLAVLKRGGQARRGGSDYAPPISGTIADIIGEVEKAMVDGQITPTPLPAVIANLTAN